MGNYILDNPPLTARQLEVVQWVRRFRATWFREPTYEEICTGAGFVSKGNITALRQSVESRSRKTWEELTRPVSYHSVSGGRVR